MNRVRFHLGEGPHKGYWQVRDGRSVEYHDPNKTSLVLIGCRLVNRSGAAKRIFCGANKTPCAWIECQSIEARPSQAASGEVVRYNPRIEPNWVFRGSNADGMEFARLQTCGASVLSK